VTYWQLERPSKRSGKKWKVRVPTSSGRGKTVAFGDASMSDYTIHKDKARRERYRTRHQRDRIDDPYAPGFWSWWSLWGESSDLDKAHAAAVKRAKKILGVKKDEEGNEVATRRNPTSPTLAEVSQVIATFNVPKRLHTEFLQGFAMEWENTPSEDFNAIGRVVLENLGEDAHHYRKLRRRKNPAAIGADAPDAPDAEPTDRVQACFDALLAIVQEQYPSLRCTIEVDERAGERGGHACARAYAFCEDLEDGAFRIAIAEKMNDPDLTDDSRVEGLLRHELAHAVLLHTGDIEHTERDADDVAEALFGSPLFYDEEDVQTTDQSAPGARRPRPAYLDDENGRTLDTRRPNPYPAGTMQLETVEDVASYLDDCAAQGDAKSPRILASQLSSKSKELAGVKARTMLSLAKAARHCADAVEARMSGQIDRAMTCERMCDRALAEAQEPGRRSNPEWAKKLGSGLYKGARYSAETARDVYHGAREAHAARSAAAPVEGERKNPHPGFDQYEFRVSSSFLPALFNGDVSGLSSEDEEALERFYKRVLPLGRGHWAVIEEDAGFGRDEITGLGSDRALIAWMVPRGRKNPRPRHAAAPVEGERKNPRRRPEKSEARKEWERRGAAIPTSELVAADVFRTHEQRALARATRTHRLPGIGTLAVRPDLDGGRDIARVEVTRSFASEWDHDILNQAYLSRDVMDAVEAHRHGSNFYAVDLVYRGRAFTRLFPRGAGI